MWHVVNCISSFLIHILITEAVQETDLQNKMRGHVCPLCLKKSINGNNIKLICLLCASNRFCC